MAIFVQVVEVIIVIFIGIAGVTVYFIIEYHRQKNAMRWKEYDLKKAEVKFYHAKTRALEIATVSRANHKIGPDNSLEVIHFFPLPASQTKITMEQPEPQKQLPPPLVIPEPLDLVQLQGVWTPRPDRLLLAIGSSGPVTVPLDKSWHIALAGPTGGGKTNTLRLLMMQLTMFHSVYMINPAYAPIKEDGTDWRPIADRLQVPPARKSEEIEDVFVWLLDELNRREEAEQAGDFSWSQEPVYVVIDEAKEVFKRYPDGPDAVCALLRRARQYKIFVILAAQDMLIKNIGGDSGARECYRTSFYFGGDQTTARALLDIKGSINEEGLGVNGLVLLRALTSPKPAHSRVPLVSNEGLYSFMNIHQPFTTGYVPIHDYSNVQNGYHHKAVNCQNTVVTGELIKDVNEPVKPFERNVNIQVNESERSAIIAAAKMQLITNGQVVRTKVRDALGWHNGDFPKIKKVLDEEGY